MYLLSLIHSLIIVLTIAFMYLVLDRRVVDNTTAGNKEVMKILAIVSKQYVKLQINCLHPLCVL